MAGRVVLGVSPGSPASAVARQLLKTAVEAATLAAGAEAVLLSNGDAEASAADGREGIRDWLHALWEARYELDDALDDYNSSLDAQQLAEEATRHTRHWFRSSTSDHETESKKLKTAVEKLNKEMHGLLQLGIQLGLQPLSLNRQSWNSDFIGDPMTYYDIKDYFEQQVLNLISMLTDKQSTSVLENNQSSSHVVMIVGCGGIGKTTLARKVLENHCTRSAFSTVIWVCGSRDFTDMGLLSAIASAAGVEAGECGRREKIEEMLASVFEGKRILLVIDDVWSHQINQNYLNNCLSVQHGSRILMTASDESVAEHVRSFHTHKVKELPFPDCLSLLSSSACLNAKQSETSMREIGITLVQKCCRVPLAIKVIGGLLRTKDLTYEEWKKVSECEGWSLSGIPDGMKEIAGPIRMAYNDLPCHLKQCFLYCLHLPEGFMISKHIVTRLWISEGFIEEQEDCSLEDTALEYYNELVLRNLLQLETESLDMARCRLNNCVRTVLRFLTKDLWTGKCRSVSSTSTQENATRPCFRTVILYRNPSGDRVLDRVTKAIKYLRVLDLSGTRIRHIPGSLEPLLHLRLLNLSRTDITELPSSIGSLRNLQFLVLQCCYRLHSLPSGISKLHNLRALNLEDTTPCLVLPRLECLEQLTTLHGFIVNSRPSTEQDTSGWPLEDLKFLNLLRSLQIKRIERIQEHLSVQRVVLSRKSHLTQLELCGSTRKAHEVTEEEARRLNDVLSSLRPPQCLESLKIVSFQGQSFPNWIQCLPNLQRLAIADCKLCEHLPAALGQLPQLRMLEVAGCSKLRTIERGQTGPTQAFPKLEQLHLDDMLSLESWEGFEAGDLPSLVELHLERCPRLRSLPSCLRHSRLLKSMLIVSADSIEAIDGLGTLRELVVQDSNMLFGISNLPALEALTVVHCSGLQDVRGLGLVKHLRVVDGQLTVLPDWLARHGGPLPEILAIVGREELLRSLVPGGKDWSAVSGIGKVYGYLPDGTPFFTYTKSTAELEAFGDRRNLNLVATSAVVRRRSKVSSHNVRKLMLAAAAVPGAICLVPSLLPTGYMEFVPNTILFFFLAYMAMLVIFIYVLRTL